MAHLFKGRPPAGDVVDVRVPVLLVHEDVNKDVEAILQPIERVQQQ